MLKCAFDFGEAHRVQRRIISVDSEKAPAPHAQPCLCFHHPRLINNVSPAVASRRVPYFHPTLPSDVPTLKSNRVVKQSLKRPLCSHWLFYFALWLDVR